MKKRFVIISSILTFLMGFFVHGIYEWLPSLVTTIFPVNESLFEHMKLIFLSPLFATTILYFIYKKKGITINNFFFGFFMSTVFNILIFYLIYLPVYKDMGENLLVTLIIYFITILLSQYVNYLIINDKHNRTLNVLGLILSIISIIVMTYYTWNPIKSDFFLDTHTNTYGIKK